MTVIIKPVVAGMFYPRDKDELKNKIKKMLSEAKDDLPIPKAIISPHAGYDYSGKTAAKAYACLSAAKNITRVVLACPSHQCLFSGISVPNADFYETPLGLIPIDKKAIDEILKFDFVKNIEEAFYKQENSLETQLPFLQMVLKNFSIVPLLVSDANPHEVSLVLEKLWGEKETLIVVSTDLSHYLDYATANKVDKKTIDAVLNLKPEKIGYDQMCGLISVLALLEIAIKKKMKVSLIDFCNSGDVCGFKDNVVGYASFHFLEIP